MRTKKLLIFSLIFTLVAFSLGLFIRVYAISADDAIQACKDKDKPADQQSCLEDLQSQWQSKIDTLNGTEDNLTNEIANTTSQIQLTELKIQNALNSIQNTESEIDRLAGSIDEVKARVTKLQASMDYQKQVLTARMQERYKYKSDNPIMVLFGAGTLSNLVSKAEYLQKMEIYDNKLLAEMASTKDAYNTQQKLYEDKKTEQETLRSKLQNQKSSLDNYKGDLADQKSQKQDLLTSTQNDEQKYQDMLKKAEEELAAYGNFTKAAGGGQISANGFGSGKEGWYFSQRDARWAGTTIGRSNDDIMDVGCLVTSVAMVYKSHGSSVTPATIARRNIFYGNTAYMTIPGEFKANWGSYSAISSTIDAQLKKGNAVIVGIHAGPYGTHFIVLSAKSGSDYIMYDPWYGPDLKLSSHYAKTSMFEAFVYD